jgi:hypothetical protein
LAGEVEALNTPTIRRLTQLRRHQLLLIALFPLLDELQMILSTREWPLMTPSGNIVSEQN